MTYDDARKIADGALLDLQKARDDVSEIFDGFMCMTIDEINSALGSAVRKLDGVTDRVHYAFGYLLNAIQSLEKLE